MPAGRPPNPLTPDASLAHAVGAEIQALRTERGLTLKALGLRAGYTAQHLSAAEHAKSDEALRLYATADWRGAAQVRLHRAAADHDAAYAEEVLSGLSEAQRRDRRVRLIARRVVPQQT